jgi:large subunit ribosomal protein L15
VNDDAQKLDDVFLKLAGKDLGLTNEVKWQAVTHKSFDHGRQPFNSKLTFLGMVASLLFV